MKPRNKLEKEIIELRKSLPAPSDKHIRFAQENCFWHYAKKTKYHILCHDCGMKFKKESLLPGEVCPNCKRKLKIDDDKRLSFHRTGYLRIIDRYKEFQVIRFFVLSKYHKFKELPNFIILKDIIEHWIGPKGELVTVARQQRHNYGYYTSYWYNDMEIRNYNPFVHNPGGMTYPKRSYVNQIKFARNIPNPGWSYHQYLAVIMNPEAETIYKAGYEKLFEVLPDRMKQVRKLWPAVKICIRNKHAIDDPNLWLDYVDSLHFFRKDIHNPHYVCPRDLHKAHDRWMKKKRKVLDKRNEKSRAKRLTSQEEEYRKIVEPFIDLKIEAGGMTITPLLSVMDVLKEGDELGHCVYTQGYYKKNTSLLLSAKRKNKRIQTIEYSLQTHTILQCRGKSNLDTKDTPLIKQLVTEAMRQRLAG